ncbi:MAG: hypothetical protein KKH98_05715 [Spirochaetes bacterium]|nr:hypothetical protein [Spirochaetota bacterium]
MKKASLILVLIFVFSFISTAGAKPSLITLTEDKILVNKKPYNIKGVAYSLTYPKCNHFTQIPMAVYEKDFKLMKAAGINTIRTYSTPPDFIFDLAEKYNIMLIVQVVYVGGWTRFDSEEEKKALIENAVENVKAHKHRKNVLMWAIWNDVPFVYDSNPKNVIEEYGFNTIHDFLKDIYKAVKKEDPDHPVTGSNMLNFPGSNLGFKFLDVIGFNCYFGITPAGWFSGKFDVTTAQDTVKQIKNLTGHLKKPVVILETGYSTYATEWKQDKAITEQLKVTDNKFAGVVIFQWADDWSKKGTPDKQDKYIEEHWGITDGYRKVKAGYIAVKKFWRNKK